MKSNLLTRFLSKTENTRKFNLQSRVRSIVYGTDAGQTPMANVVWGNLDPATMRLLGNYENAIEKEALSENFKINREYERKNIVVLERNCLTVNNSRDNKVQIIKSP